METSCKFYAHVSLRIQQFGAVRILAPILFKFRDGDVKGKLADTNERELSPSHVVVYEGTGTGFDARQDSPS